MDEYIEKAMAFVERYKAYYGWREDEIQDGYLAFIKYYKPDKASPDTYIKICMDSVIRNQMRNQYLQKNAGTKVWFDKTFEGGDERTEIELNMINYDPPKEMQFIIDEEEQITKGKIASLLHLLTDKEHFAITKYYFEEKTLEEIGEEVGVSRQAINHQIKNALHKMRKNM